MFYFIVSCGNRFIGKHYKIPNGICLVVKNTSCSMGGGGEGLTPYYSIAVS